MICKHSIQIRTVRPQLLFSFGTFDSFLATVYGACCSSQKVHRHTTGTKAQMVKIFWFLHHSVQWPCNVLLLKLTEIKQGHWPKYIKGSKLQNLLSLQIYVLCMICKTLVTLVKALSSELRTSHPYLLIIEEKKLSQFSCANPLLSLSYLKSIPSNAVQFFLN